MKWVDSYKVSQNKSALQISPPTVAKHCYYHIYTSEIETSHNEYIITALLFLHSSFFLV